MKLVEQNFAVWRVCVILVATDFEMWRNWDQYYKTDFAVTQFTARF